MSPDGSVTRWIGPLKMGDPAAVQQLWERYFRRLVGLARKKLQGDARLVADKEDVALSAFDSFCRHSEEGRFPGLQDRDDLWRLLVTITVRKAVDRVRTERRRKRGGGAVLDEAALAIAGDSSDVGLEQIVGREPTPAFAAQVAEEYRRLLEALRDDTMRNIAVWKMEGDTTKEVAAKLGCAPITVERKLRRIREIWASEVAE